MTGAELPFVGRERELDSLTSLVSAQRAQPDLVLLVGEPGAGKSRLLDEFLTQSSEADKAVLLGRCDEQALRPYQPFAEAISTQARRDPGTDESLAPRLAALAPAWHSEDDRADARDTETARMDLFDAVVDYLDSRDAAPRKVLAIEDLHWAATETWAMLRHVVESAYINGPLIVATVRPFDSLDSEASAAMAHLLRVRATTMLELHGLHERDIAALAHASGLDGQAEMVTRLLDRTRGNALFVTQLLAHARSGGSLDDLPASLQHVLRQRLAGLTEPTLALLRIAALIGDVINYRVLSAATSLPELDVLDAFDVATHSGILIEIDSDNFSYGFSHALMRDAINATTNAPRRASIHRAIAEAMEGHTSRDGGDVSALAYHWVRADGPDAAANALRYAVEAARLSIDRLAPEDAVRTLTPALDRAAREPASDGRLRVVARLLLARAFDELGQADAFRRMAEAAADEARGVADDLFVEAAYVRAMSPAVGTHDGTAQSLARDALERIADDDFVWRSRLLRAIAGLQFFGDAAPNDALQTLEGALTTAQRSGSGSVLGDVYGTLSFVLQPLPDIERRIRTIREWDRLTATAVNSATGAPRGGAVNYGPVASEGNFWAKRALAQALLEAGDTAYLAAFDGAVARVVEGRSRLALRAIDTFRTSLALMRGEFDSVEPRTNGHPQRGDGRDDNAAVIIGQFFMLRREQGRMDEILPLAESMLTMRPGFSLVEPAYALGHVDTGSEAEARSAAARILDRQPMLPQDVVWLAGMMLVAEVVASLGIDARADHIYEQLVPYVGRVVVIGVNGAVFGAVDRALGQLASLAGRYDVADDHFGNALATEQRFGAAPLVARTAYWWARSLLERPTPDIAGADRYLAQSIDIASRLGMTLLGQQARSLLAGDDTVLATILFTDIVDSTLELRRRGDAEWRAVLDEHDRAVRATVAAHGGDVVDFAGDGCLSMFGSPARAVRAALALRSLAHSLGLELRAGIHTGECQQRGSGLAGIAVHIGARIGASAHGGEVRVSRTVVDLVAGSGLRFMTLGTHELKGVGAPVELFGVDG